MRISKAAVIGSMVWWGFMVSAQTPPASPAAAASYQQARDAIAKRDYSSALAILKPLAEQGMARAQSTLGTMYAIGMGVPRNPT
jgi:hypothetical protein